MGITLTATSVRGWEYDSDYVPSDWKEEGAHKNGQFDMGMLNRWCGYFYTKQACTADRSGFLECEITASQRKMLTKKCGPGTLCECKKDWQDFGACRCIDPTKRPLFPSTGSITWNGSLLFEKFYPKHDKWSYPLKGELQVTNDGHFLFKTIEYKGGWWWDEPKPTVTTSVTIIVPNTDGSFTHYKGDGKGSCHKSVISADTRRTLSWLWRYFSKDDPREREYELKYRRGKIQKWGLLHDARSRECEMGCSDDYREWSMDIQVLDGGKVAVPMKFFMRKYLDVEIQWDTNVVFKYRSTTDEDSFHVSDYCNAE